VKDIEGNPLAFDESRIQRDYSEDLKEKGEQNACIIWGHSQVFRYKGRKKLA